MYEPRFQLTHTILSNIISYEVIRKGIIELRLESENKSKFRMYANSNDIFHLGHLFGANVTLKTARKVASGKTLKLSDYKGMYLTNFRSAIEYINSTQTSYYPV